MAIYIGLDLGGTNIKCGVVNDDGQVLAKTSTPTGQGQDVVLNNMAQAARQTVFDAGLEMVDVAAVGIGSPGPLDSKAGVVINASNIQGMIDCPIVEKISEALGVASVLENDADAAAYGEYWAGAGRDSQVHHFVMLTLGTGVGMGAIIDGQLLRGAFGHGAEGGHVIVAPGGRLCNCGQRGCVEAYASASQTACRAREAMASGEVSSLCDIFEKNPKAVTAKAVFDAAIAGDQMADQIVDKTSQLLAILCVNISRIIEPQMIVFAGGMSLAGRFLIDRVMQYYHEYNWTLTDDLIKMTIAELGNDAGIVGAAGVAMVAHQQGKLATLQLRKN